MATPATASPAPSFRSSGRLLTLQAALFLATMLTTTCIGMRYADNFAHGRFPLASDADLFPFAWVWQNRAHLATGLPFSLTLMTFLLTHEFGHYFACRYFRVAATLPFLLPMPSLSGSAGAVISLRQRVRTRRALLGIGAAGPLAGFVVAIATTFLGLHLSVPVSTPPQHFVQLNSPLLFVAVQRLLHHPAHMTLLWHPVLLASWIGVLVTSLNLIPAGQFDGGHILYALSPRAHHAATLATGIALALLSVTSFIGWLLWAGLLLSPALRKPILKDKGSLSPRSKWMALAAFSILLLSLTPEPIAHASLLALLPLHH